MSQPYVALPFAVHGTGETEKQLKNTHYLLTGRKETAIARKK